MYSIFTFLILNICPGFKRETREMGRARKKQSLRQRETGMPREGRKFQSYKSVLKWEI